MDDTALNFTMKIENNVGLIRTLFLCVLLAVVCGNGNAQEKSEDSDIGVTINFNNTEMKDVFEEVSRQTDWNILFDQDLKNEKITGNYLNEPVDSFFKKILKGKNFIILYDIKQKIIEIRNFGNKKSTIYLVNKGRFHKESLSSEAQDLFFSHVQALSQLDGSNSELIAGSPLDGATLNEIIFQQSQQKKVYAEYLDNPESIEPLTGMTLGAIADRQSQQKKVYAEYLDNPESIEPLTEMRLGAITDHQANLE